MSTTTCHACGEPTLRSYLTHADDLRDEVVALLGIGDRGHACDVCVSRAAREIDGAEEAIALDSDPFFAEVCDARHEAYLTHVLDAETAVQWAALARCGGDALDAAVTA